MLIRHMPGGTNFQKVHVPHLFSTFQILAFSVSESRLCSKAVEVTYMWTSSFKALMVKQRLAGRVSCGGEESCLTQTAG